MAKARTCKGCHYCKIAYRRYGYRLQYSTIYPHYYCIEKDAFIDRRNVCEKWQRKKAEYDLSPQRLEEVEQDIKFLIEYFNK